MLCFCSGVWLAGSEHVYHWLKRERQEAAAGMSFLLTRWKMWSYHFMYMMIMISDRLIAVILIGHLSSKGKPKNHMYWIKSKIWSYNYINIISWVLFLLKTLFCTVVKTSINCVTGGVKTGTSLTNQLLLAAAFKAFSFSPAVLWTDLERLK